VGRAIAGKHPRILTEKINFEKEENFSAGTSALNHRVLTSKRPQIHHKKPSKDTVENAKPLLKRHSTTRGKIIAAK
jgi:hypothetical protein